jgi:hypothetical protein
MIDADERSMEDTIPLTEAAESGAISPTEYARRRADIVGEGTIVEYTIVPLLSALWRRFFHPGVQAAPLVKAKRDS